MKLPEWFMFIVQSSKNDNWKYIYWEGIVEPIIGIIKITDEETEENLLLQIITIENSIRISLNTFTICFENVEISEDLLLKFLKLIKDRKEIFKYKSLVELLQILYSTTQAKINTMKMKGLKIQ
jgi:hypothetical protein